MTMQCRWNELYPIQSRGRKGESVVSGIGQKTPLLSNGMEGICIRGTPFIFKTPVIRSNWQQEMMHDKEREPILFPFIWVVPHLTPVDLIRFQFYLEIVLLIEGGSVWTAKQWSIPEDLLPFRSSWFEINCSSIKERIRIDFSAETRRWLFEGSPPVVIQHKYNPKHLN